jgi:hypothetical protein
MLLVQQLGIEVPRHHRPFLSPRPPLDLHGHVVATGDEQRHEIWRSVGVDTTLLVYQLVNRLAIADHDDVAGANFQGVDLPVFLRPFHEPVRITVSEN